MYTIYMNLSLTHFGLWGPTDIGIKVPFGTNSFYSPFSSGVGQNVARNALPGARSSSFPIIAWPIPSKKHVNNFFFNLSFSSAL